MSRLPRVLTAAALLVLGAVACSSTDDSPTSPSVTSPLETGDVEPESVESNGVESPADAATASVPADETPRVEVEAITEVEQELASLDEDLDAIEDALAEIDALLGTTEP